MLFLDPLLVYTLQMGIVGATSHPTVASQAITTPLRLSVAHGEKVSLHFRLNVFRMEGKFSDRYLSQGTIDFSAFLKPCFSWLTTKPLKIMATPSSAAMGVVMILWLWEH